jgi:hypothetical protein
MNLFNTPEAIAEALNFCLDHPQHLQTFSENSIQPSEYNLLKLQHHLQELANAIICLPRVSYYADCLNCY